MNHIKILISLIVLPLLFSCTNNQPKTDEQKPENTLNAKPYLVKGKEIALKTKKILGGNLKKAIEKNGIIGALSFCNIHAMSLTDSASKAMNAYIKRVSDKVRNPDNIANEMELAYIVKAKKLNKEGEDIKPQIQEINGKMVAYYPIKTNGMCLQCHGNKSSVINESTLAKINELYPDDKATDYKDNELRGIWVVEMEK